MDYINYNNRSSQPPQPPSQQQQQQQQQQSSSSSTHLPHHHPPTTMNYSFPHHLQLQPVLLPPGYQQPAASTQPVPPHIHMQPTHHHHTVNGPIEGSSFVAPRASALSFASQRGARNLQQDVPPFTHLPRSRQPGQDIDNILNSVMQGMEPSVGGTQHAVQQREPPAADNSIDPADPADPPTLATLTPSRPLPHQQTQAPPPARTPLAEVQPKAPEDLPLSCCDDSFDTKAVHHVFLPEGLEYVYGDEGGKVIRGVVAGRVIEKGERFGPFNGALLDEEAGREIGSTWELYIRGNVWFYIDGRNKLHNNWLFHVSPARTRDEQNLEAYQSYGDIYYRALDTIQPGAELRVFYCDEYRQRVGFKTSLEELMFDKDTGKFTCTACESMFQTSKSIMRHLKFSHASPQPSMAESLQERVSKKARLMQGDDPKKAEKKSENPKTRAISVASSELSTANQNKGGHFVCVTCGKNFPSSGRLIAHERFHESTCEKFECDMCGEVCRTSFALVRHKVKHEYRDFKCIMCVRTFGSTSTVNRHMREVHGVEPGRIVCKGCSKTFRKKNKIFQHLSKCKAYARYMKKRSMRASDDSSSEDYSNVNDGGGGDDDDDDDGGGYDLSDFQEKFVEEKRKYRKKVADAAGAESQSFERTEPVEVAAESAENKETGLIDMLGIRLSQDMRRPFACQFCRRRFTKKEAKEKHENDRHPNRRVFKCDHCHLTFAYRMRYVTHMRKHSQDRRYKCQQCPRSFASESALTNHQQEHTDLKPHKCEPCIKAFRTRKQLMNHVRRIHSIREMRYACTFCDKKFAEKSALTIHERRHKGIRPHVCLTCGKAFTSKHCLVSHNRVHTGEKPFKCPTCGKGFPMNHHLEHHLLTHSRQPAK